MSSKKYFIAIIIKEPLFSEIEGVKLELFNEQGLKGALRSPAHITLHRPFEWKEEKENILIEKLSSFAFDLRFKIELKDFGFFEPRVIYVDVLPEPLLFDLHKKLSFFAKRELRLFNESGDTRGFHPHVTVAFRDLKKSKFYELQKIFVSKKIEGRFECNNFSLLKLEKNWEVLKTFSF